MKDFVVGLIGNPNSGKTTLFNDLTGAHQHVGNWPGVTVEKKAGEFHLHKHRVQLVDLPGIYSLEQEYLGLDERIARDFLAAGEIDVIINIVDAHNLHRNLVLTQQLLEGDRPVVVALNMMDVAIEHGINIDPNELSRRLGVPVVPVVASRGEGVEALKERLLILFESGESKQAPGPKPSENISIAGSTSEKLVARYHEAERITDGVMSITPVHDSLTSRIDAWVLNRWLGIPFFLFMIYLMFTVAINFGAVFIDFFDILFGAVLVDTSRYFLDLAGLPEWSIVLLADGLGGGIQLVATFIPVIGFLFLCLSILEDSGYMSRAAFVVDRLMSRLGLPGTAFVPLIVGFGCNVPSVMAARSLGRESDRLLTITMAPFMSCGARLTVYALFAAAFFPTNGQNVVFALYLLGIGMAVMTGFIFRRQIFKAETTPSFQEMPVYHIPVLRNILLTTWFRLRSFIFRAGKTIVAVVVVLSFLNSISLDGSFGNEDSENSVLASIGKAITPVFTPIGLQPDNWAATVGLFTGLFAKEAVVGTLDALYSGPANTDPGRGAPNLLAAGGAALTSIADNAVDLAGRLGDPLGVSIGDMTDTARAAESQGVNTATLTNMAALFGSQFAAFCYLVFVLLYAPCVAVMGTIAKEAGWRWMVLVFGWTTGLAYLTSSMLYQMGTFSSHPAFSLSWIVGCLVVFGLMVLGLKSFGRRAASHHLISAVQIG
jgi:ferrous iron transport protein B